MNDRFSGKAWVYGDNVDTDVIIPARYLSTSDPAELAPHCMEDLDPGFARKMDPGDIIVAGDNFGCGSTREHAPLAIKGAGCSCVIAASFARIFYRNAINVGRPIFECPEAAASIETGDEVAVDPVAGTIENRTKGVTFRVAPFAPFLRDLISAGGLIPYARRRIEERRKGA